jgi:hypothetical protein
MTFRMMATIALMGIVAGASGGCSAVPSALQGQNAYGSAGRLAPARTAYATSPSVEVPGERVIGADPDVNVRFDLNREGNFHLHGSGN